MDEQNALRSVTSRIVIKKLASPAVPWCTPGSTVPLKCSPKGPMPLNWPWALWLRRGPRQPWSVAASVFAGVVFPTTWGQIKPIIVPSFRGYCRSIRCEGQQCDWYDDEDSILRLVPAGGRICSGGRALVGQRLSSRIGLQPSRLPGCCSQAPTA